MQLLFPLKLSESIWQSGINRVQSDDTYKFTTCLLQYRSVVLHMLFSYPACNINLILKFYVGLKHIRAVTSAVLQKMRQQGENLMMKIQMGWSLVRGRRGLEPCLPWGKANIQGA